MRQQRGARRGGPRRARHGAATQLILALVCVHTHMLTQVDAGQSLTVQTCPISSAIFDTASLSCSTCGTAVDARAPSNASRDAWMRSSADVCVCKGGYSATSPACDPATFAGCPTDICTSCVAQGLASSRVNATACVACDGSTSGLDTSTGECVCFTGATGTLALTEASATGAWLGAKSCAACGSRSRVFAMDTAGWPADLYACATCTDPHATLSATGDCVCDTGFRATGVPGLQQSGGTGNAIACVDERFANALSSAYPETNAILVNFNEVQDRGSSAVSSLTGRTSKYMQHYFLRSAVGCQTWSSGERTTPCHALANLCVLQMHQPSATACQLYTVEANARRGAVHTFQNWPTSMPFLYYSTDATSVVTDAVLARKMSFDSSGESDTSDKLQFVLAKFALNGTFLGLERLTNQLSYCGAGSTSAISDEPPWLQFGYGYTSTHTCSLRALVASGEPVFYDLYVRDLAADAASPTVQSSSTLVGTRITLPITLYPVPVRIVNFRAADGSKPNQNTAMTDEANDVFTRRFVLYDTVSGVTNVGDAPEVVRYASSITITVNTRRDASLRPTLVNPPVLTIQYSERLYASMLNDDTGYGRDTLTFNVEYISDQVSYQNSVLALAVTVGIVAAMWSIAKVVAWARMNARTDFEAAVSLKHLAYWIAVACFTGAMVYFWFAWIISLYWLVFFKLQTQVYALLPAWRPSYSDNEYAAFDAGIIVLWVAFILRIAFKIWYQVRVDIFFIDWEKPRGAVLRTGQDHEAALGKTVAAGLPGAIAPPNKFSPISVWRTIHVANEWAELSTQRRLNLPFALLVLVVILQAGGVRYVATAHPNAHDLSPGPLNPILQFANAVFWWLVIVAFQMLYIYALGERYLGENPSSRFIDVCTISKVSVFIMDHKYHGYYLHGNAPHEHADGDMRELANHLFEEAAAMRMGRGLPGCPDPACQTFELHVPALWREQYDRVYRRLVDSETAAVESMARDATMARMGGHGMHGAPGQNGAMPQSIASASHLARAKERTQRLHAAFLALGGFLRGFIEETDPDYKRVWRERTLWQQLFDLPPDMITEGMMAGAAGSAVGGPGGGRLTYTMLDRNYRFERTIFRGIEFDLMIMDILTFALVDRWTAQPTVAAVVTFIIAQVLVVLRSWLGNRNIAFKTLVDERFLL